MNTLPHVPASPDAVNRPFEGHIQGACANAGCYMIKVLTLKCITCGREVQSGPFTAFGFPYHAVAHMACAPYAPLTGEYPHELAAAAYGAFPNAK